MTRIRFIRLLCVAIAALLLASCSPDTAAPAPTGSDGAFQPLPLGETASAVVLIPDYIEGSGYQRVAERLNETLKAAGQGVAFKLLACKYDDMGRGDFAERIKPELAAGKPSADGYALGMRESGALYDSGLTMDMTGLVAEFAPAYLARYGSLFKPKLTGVPTGIYRQPLWRKTALMLRRDIAPAGRGIRTLDDLFRFAEDMIVKPGKKYTLQCSPAVLVAEWALEQGYCALGMDGYLFVRADDSPCVPVPLESIPGLERFISAMMTYYMNGTLSSSFGAMPGLETIGYMRTLSDFYIYSSHSWRSWVSGDFIAQLLSPELPGVFIDPSYSREITVARGCPREKAEAIVRFIEWQTASQANYDSMLYGEPGVDFNPVGTRFFSLTGGAAPGDRQAESPFFAWPGAEVFGVSDYFRLPADAPANLEQLMDAGVKSSVSCAAAQSIRMDWQAMDALADPGGEAKAVAMARDMAYTGLFLSDFNEGSYAAFMDELAQCRTDVLLERYREILRGLAEKD